ncbi:MAG: hypothetical protein ACI909_003685, partial [Planctomycetota bacterium]
MFFNVVLNLLGVLLLFFAQSSFASQGSGAEVDIKEVTI